MTDRQRYPENAPGHHTIKIKGLLSDTIEDVSKIDDPRGQAFETTTEVLGGLVRAYEDYQQRSEEAWRAERVLGADFTSRERLPPGSLLL